MYRVAELRAIEPWIQIGVLVFRGDALGTDAHGRACVMDEDSVVTGIVRESWGVLVGYRRATLVRGPGPVD